MGVASLKELVELIQSLLDRERDSTGVQLEVNKTPFREEDGWVHFVVVPANGSARAERYAEALAKVETEVRKQTGDQVVLVPARD